MTTNHSHQGRPISVEFHSTPQLYAAYFTQEYDGAPDSHCPMGFGKTEDAAVADLIAQGADYCDCGVVLNSEKEKRDGVCWGCL